MRGPLARFAHPTEVPVEEKTHTPNDKEGGVVDNQPQSSEASNDIDAIDSDAQAGVQKIEATTKVWSMSHLILAYVFIWIIYFVDSMQQGMGTLLNPYVTSAFALHSLTATTGVMSGIIGGVSKLTLAKILDIWGRPQGFLIVVLLMTVGLVMMAACNNVETYAAAQVFYWVGYNGVSYSLSVFIADTSHLKNRALMLAFISSPYIITVWISAPMTDSILSVSGIGWRWGFGIFSIITPIMCLPLFFLFTWNYQKAKKEGLIVNTPSGRTTWESIKYYFWQFDVICLILVTGGFALFLLPFNIYSYQYYGWKDPLVICLIIFGGLLLIGSVVWERFFAPVKFMPWELLKDRTVLGACILSAVLFVEYYIWTAYFSSFLQVVLNLDVTQTGYIGNIYSLGSCFFSFVVGFLIRWTGRFKWITLYFGVPVTILSIGLLIHFRQPGTHLGWIIMCEILYAFAGGACVIGEQMAVMAAAAHQHVAVVLAMEGMFSSVGGAIGGTVSAAIWTGVFPTALAKYLPAESQANLTAIYSQLPVQLSYPVGSPTRDAIILAYGDGLRWMFVAATAVTVLGLVSVAVWRDIKVSDFKQVKGRVI
ncbi:MFS general substrate transporter [Daldinia caldariorum]|uniref:MFS general substrate transporter n=1 Tax=Daldinia caldariorum TaxID=326644 RepID=UPI002007DF7F|nr:MFS general substrate transporter [Daldinia caldariorum]KAI1471295.1 MFS general substrate transporter [Daldinia caldariorum]